MNIEFWKILVPSLIAILVAFGSHQLAVHRSLLEHRRKQRTDYLIGAFRALMMNSNNPNMAEAIPALRDAAISIQFLGKKEQSEMMQKIIHSMLKDEEASLDSLLASLRDDIRKELNLGKIESGIFWIHPKQGDRHS